MGARLKLYILLSYLLGLNLFGQVDSIVSPEKHWRQEVESLLADSSTNKDFEAQMQLAGFWLFRQEGHTLYTGPKMRIGGLEIDSMAEDASPRVSAMPALNENNYQNLLRQELQIWENKGYPFAAFRLMEYRLEEHTLFAKLHLQKGPLVVFDSLAVLGYQEIDPQLLQREIAWKKNQVYSQAYLNSLSDYLGRLEYLQMERAPAVGFIQDKARVYLYISKRAANLINGVIGLNTDNEGNSTLTGDFRLRLLNLFNRGSALDLRWQSPGQSSQDLQLALAYPYLFRTPIGFKAQMEIFRQDSSFIRQDFQLAFPYRLARGASLRLGIQYLSTGPLGSNSSNLQVQEVRNLRYLLGWELDRRNDAIVSTKGYFIDLSLGSGQRRLNEVENQQYVWEAKFEYYLPVYKAWHWHQDLRSAGLSGTSLQDNEVYRLGGIQTLRGFNEWSFFSPNYHLLRSELRYMLGRYDYLSALFDFAYAQTNQVGNQTWNRHTGLGLGLNFQTKGGIFSLIFASGQSNNAAYDFRNGKIHLAYVNRF